jgi:aminoglycoside phosphotransferase (APT) family kinase protein
LTSYDSETPDELAARLGEFIGRHHGGRRVRIEGLKLLTGGASRQTWSFDAVIEPEAGPGAEKRLAIVLRRDPRQAAAQGLDRLLEYRVLAAAHAEGVAVPKPYLPGDDSLGAPFFLMERVEGETLPRRLLRDQRYERARAAMGQQLAAILARIHRIPTEKYELGALPSPPAGRTPAETELDRFEDMYRRVAADPHPALELGFRWLRARAPRMWARSERPVLVHGDFRVGNVIFGPEGVRAMLDWELAHIGDPMEDVGWLCVRSWRFGNDGLVVGGVARREDFRRAYEEAGGYPVDAERVRFWELFGNLRWGVFCLSLARPYLDGHSRSVELAAIGRRTAETEWELLNLMEA